jgi:hypothetical protein
MTKKMKQQQFIIGAVILAALAMIFSVFRKNAMKRVKEKKGWIACLVAAQKYWNADTQSFENYSDASPAAKSGIKVLTKEIATGKWGDPADLNKAIAGHTIWVQRNFNAFEKSLW